MRNIWSLATCQLKNCKLNFPKKLQCFSKINYGRENQLTGREKFLSRKPEILGGFESRSGMLPRKKPPITRSLRKSSRSSDSFNTDNNNNIRMSEIKVSWPFNLKSKCESRVPWPNQILETVEEIFVDETGCYVAVRQRKMLALYSILIPFDWIRPSH